MPQSAADFSTIIGEAFFWLWPLSLFLLTGVYLLVPEGWGPFAVASLLMLGLAVISLIFPVVLLYFVLLTSVLSSVLRNLDSITVGGTEVSLSGLRWIWVAAIAIVVLVINHRQTQLRGPFFPLLLFSGWVATRWLGSPTGVGLRDVLFYALPAVIAVFAVLMLRTSSSRLINHIETSLLLTSAIPVIAYAIFIPAGLVKILEGMGPEGLIDPRTTAEYLIVVLCVAVARWRYGASPGSRKVGLAIALLCLATSMLTLSRAATLTGLLLLGVARANVWQFRKLIAAVTLGALFIGGSLFLFPSFRARFSVGPDAVFSEEFPYINTEGRIFFWTVTAEHAVEKPMLGWGPGSARLLVGAAIPDSEYEEYHPHNEYLQVFHDLGLVGLLLMLLGWVPLLRVHWRRWRASDALGDNMAAQWHMSAFLALAVVLLSSAVGNTLHETFVAAPALILSACAFSCARSMQTYARQRSA